MMSTEPNNPNMPQKGQLHYDEYGRPFILLEDQENKTRVHGIEMHKKNIQAATNVCETLRTSLGPKGMDKVVIDSYGKITVTNDGATILNKMSVTNRCAKLLVDLSKSQDDQIGDGTTGVVIIAGALLKGALELIDKGIHPKIICQGYQEALQMALGKLEDFATSVSVDDKHILRAVAQTALTSKVVAGCSELFSDIATSAVTSVFDDERKDANFELIKILTRPGGCLKDSELCDGVIIDKDLSHFQMDKVTENPKIAILTSPFEPPKPKTKHNVDITSVADYKKLENVEKMCFESQIEHLKRCGANFVLCQWGFDNEANSLLYQNKIPSVRWVAGNDIELISIATGGRIVPRFDMLTPEKLGTCGTVCEEHFGSDHTPMVVFKNCASKKAITVVLHASTTMMVEEAERSLHDAMCCVRNVLVDGRVLPGGGAVETALAECVGSDAELLEDTRAFVLKTWAQALMTIPECLAENSGFSGIDKVSRIAKSQSDERCVNIGLNCLTGDVENMVEKDVLETYSAKRAQLSLATQAACMILRIDDSIGTDQPTQ